MSCLISLLVLLVLVFLAGPWVLLGLQYRRQREQSSRLDALQGELLALRTRFERATVPAAEPVV